MCRCPCARRARADRACRQWCGCRRAAALATCRPPRRLGSPYAEYPIWFGIFAPAGTSRDIVAQLHRETAKVLQERVVIGKLAALGVEPMPMTPAAFDEHVKREIVLNSALVKATGLAPN